MFPGMRLIRVDREDPLQHLAARVQNWLSQGSVDQLVTGHARHEPQAGVGTAMETSGGSRGSPRPRGRLPA
jgi:hypothetical protein